MTEKDKLELMRRFEPFGREIPKDQVMSVIARVPTESSESEKHQLQEEIPTNTPTKSTNISTKSTNISTNPSADRPKGEWIPCEERMPSEKKAVLICDSRGNLFAGELVLTDTGYKWKIPLFTVWMDIEDGDAWMPLPKPFGERSEEE